MSRRVVRHTRRSVLAVAAVAVLGTAVGCGSSDSSTSSNASTGSSTSSSGTTAESASLKYANEQVAKYSALPGSIGYKQQLSGPVTGKNVYFLKPGVPVGEEIAKGIVPAAKLLGINLKILNAGTTPDTYKAALQQVVNAKPKADGLIISGQEPSFYTTEMKKLEAQGTPVVASSIAKYEGIPVVKGRVIKVEDWQFGGRLAADYIYSQNKGEGNTVFFDLANYPILNEGVGKGFSEEYKKLCASCKFSRVAVQASTIGTQLPGIMASYIQKNPDTKWIFAGIGDMLIGVPQALKAAGLADKVKAVSYSGTPPNYQYLKNDQVQTAIIGYANIEGAWAMINEISQAMRGDTVEQPVQPEQIITKPSLADFDVAAGWPGAKDYEAQFKVLWAKGLAQ